MKKLFLFAGIVAVLALIPLSSLMATQDEAPATTDQIMLVSLDEAPVLGPKTLLCHITGEGVRGKANIPIWTGHIIEVSVNALNGHCGAGHGFGGAGDHNPAAGRGRGLPCNRAKAIGFPPRTCQ